MSPLVSIAKWDIFKFKNQIYRIKKSKYQNYPQLWNLYDIQVWEGSLKWEEVNHPTAKVQAIIFYQEKDLPEDIFGDWKPFDFTPDGRATRNTNSKDIFNQYRIRTNQSPNNAYYSTYFDIETKSNLWGWTRVVDNSIKIRLLDSLNITSKNYSNFLVNLLD
jgi:hypothetical protein